jgi:hypothetical protein
LDSHRILDVTDDELVDALGAFAADLPDRPQGRRVRACPRRHPRRGVGTRGGPDAAAADLAALAVEFVVALLPAPGPDMDPAYRVVVFFCREPRYEMVATYNTAALGPPRLAVQRGGRYNR